MTMSYKTSFLMKFDSRHNNMVGLVLKSLMQMVTVLYNCSELTLSVSATFPESTSLFSSKKLKRLHYTKKTINYT